jgi:integrase
MNPSENIWERPAIGFTPAQQLLVPELRAWLRQHNLPLAGWLADLSTDGPPVSIKLNAMEDLQQSIENEFESLKKAHHALVLLGKFVAYANQIGKGPIPQPCISHLVLKPPNPFAEGVAEALTHMRTLLEIEREWIEECADAPPIELVVFSAVLHGGLLHQSVLIQLTRTLLTAPEEALGLVGNRVSIDLKLPWQGVQGAENRRWYPDDQTVALIRRPEAYTRTAGWEDPSTLSDALIGKLLFKKIRQRIRSCHVADAWTPQTWKQLLDTVATAARIDMPAVLIEYATRRIVSHSLKLDTLQRIFGLSETVEPAEDLNEIEPALADAGDPQVFTEPSNDQEPDWLCFLRRAFRATDSHALQALLQARINSISDVSSPGHCITRFALYLLTQRHQDPDRFVRRKPLRLNTVKSLTLTVGKRFGCILGDQNPVDLTPENLETSYTQVLENVVEGENPNRLRGTVAYALREFQEFLVLHCDGASINVREVLGCSRGLLPVDSKIITPEQYSEARHFLRSNPEDAREWKDSELRHAAEAMLILGFRCGTRRMEAHGLELEDLTDRSSAWLWVRPTEARQLKTSNAKRQLPLFESLIPESELEVLYSWKEKRIQQGVSKECPYLFATRGPNANGGTVQRQIPVQKLISLIHRALRNATGDHSLHYHHLRHSFATWSFLRLMLSDLPQPTVLFPHLPETTAWIESGKTFRKDLYGTGHPTRKHAMAVASLLGHSGPSVSIEHYIHCMDWLLNAFLSQSKLLRVPSTHQAILASARPGSALYKRNKDPGGGPIPVHLIETHFPNLAIEADNVDKRMPSGDAAIHTDASWTRNTWDLLFQYSRSDDPLDSLAEELGFNPACANSIFARAIKVQNITASRGRRSKPHRMKSISVEKEHAEQSRCATYPEIPHGKEDLKVIRDWEARLLTIQHSQPEATRSVLGYYVNHVWKTSNVLLFHDPAKPETAVRYLSFLEALGVEDNQLRLVFFGQSEHKKSAFRRQWKQTLKLTWRLRDSIYLWKPPYGESAASERWLGLEPSFGNQPHRAGRQGSDGFRFLMVMAAIAFGYAGDEEPYFDAREPPCP